MRWIILSSLGLVMACSSPTMDDQMLTDTTDTTIIHDGWRVVNDTVMGGVSASRWTVSPNDGYGIFSGNVSLENYGGFASVRGDTPSGHFGHATEVKLNIKGDGKTYKFCIRTTQMGPSVSYQHDVVTTGDVQEVVLPLDAFIPRWRGRVVGDALTLNAADISGVGFLISDKQEGPFSLIVSRIEPAE